jgi:hypothetical protein
MLALPSGDFDELVKQLATSLASRQPRIPCAHLLCVFFDAFFTHTHGWRHGVSIYEATALSQSLMEIFMVSASMRQHAPQVVRKQLLPIV